MHLDKSGGFYTALCVALSPHPLDAHFRLPIHHSQFLLIFPNVWQTAAESEERVPCSPASFPFSPQDAWGCQAPHRLHPAHILQPRHAFLRAGRGRHRAGFSGEPEAPGTPSSRLEAATCSASTCTAACDAAISCILINLQELIITEAFLAD